MLNKYRARKYQILGSITFSQLYDSCITIIKGIWLRIIPITHLMMKLKDVKKVCYFFNITYYRCIHTCTHKYTCSYWCAVFTRQNNVHWLHQTASEPLQDKMHLLLRWFARGTSLIHILLFNILCGWRSSCTKSRMLSEDVIIVFWYVNMKIVCMPIFVEKILSFHETFVDWIKI